jgi:hypothetical protein
MAFFESARPAPGSGCVAVVLGPLEVLLDGLDDALTARLTRRYTPWVAERASRDDALTVRVALAPGADYFIDPPATSETVRVLLACDGTRVRYLSYRVAGWFDTTPGGRGELVLAAGDWEPVERAFENYVRSAVAWQAASRGGALVHAASAVLGDRGYLFYGESGAGKSTLSACNRRGRVLSDDLSLVLPECDGLHVVGSPFRGTYEGGGPVVGSFPLRAGFRLIKAERAAVREVPRVRAMAELVGNLPFVAEAFGERPDLFERIDQAFAPIPLAHLHFRKDDSYWDAIRDAGY